MWFFGTWVAAQRLPNHLINLKYLTIGINKIYCNTMTEPDPKKRNIPRFSLSLKKKLKTNPEQHLQPLNSYFNKVRRDSCLLNLGEEINQQQLFEEEKVSMTKISYESGSFHKYHSTSYSFKANADVQPNTKKPQNDKESQQKASKSHRSKLSLTKVCKTEDQGQKQAKKEYMSYTQYENLLQKGVISPNYFQKAANKNDRILQNYKNKAPQNRTSKNKSQSRQGRIHLKIKTEVIESLFEDKKKKKCVALADFEPKPATTIINTKLGYLSHCTIKQKLEQKWEKQLKSQKVKRIVPTEESQLASDTRQISARDGSHAWSFRKKIRNDAESATTREAELQSITNQKYRNRLRKIFTERQRSAANEQNMSRGEEYNYLQENMAKIDGQYVPKRLVIKHKIDWKV